MQQHRQVVLLRQLQLGFVNKLLSRHVQTWHKTIEANFTHRHQTRVVTMAVQSLVQGLQILFAGLRGVQGMDA